jgi:large exoprotein involved in heme utilization and adhesion
LDGDGISAKQQIQVRESKLDKNKVEITEAQGLVKNTDGSVELVAMAPTVTPGARGTVSNCPI